MDVSRHDQRRHARSPIRVTPVKMCDGHGCFHGYAKDISRSGVSIHTVRQKEAGDEFNIELTLPMTGITVSCIGKVVWSRIEGARGLCMGLKFSDMDQAVAARIDRWVKRAIRS